MRQVELHLARFTKWGVWRNSLFLKSDTSIVFRVTRMQIEIFKEKGASIQNGFCWSCPLGRNEDVNCDATSTSPLFTRNLSMGLVEFLFVSQKGHRLY